ncbi:thioredoxin domain-containing protein 3 homolog [Periplaneta americana]|uniref:thioredoxin domain-containing protein 3 homolog n=1 Tax=Periplaneta americana TaxID=6978 RepID=UPI0037E9BC50
MAKRGMARGRKMAGKKGQVVQLQSEINTEEDWQSLLAKEGLIVVDVYSEWCGPCLGMVGTLKKIKLEVGGDFLTFAIAKSDGIEALARFRNRSEPTWMFIAGGQLVNLMFGADAPRLMNLIIKEISNEKEVLAGTTTRKGMAFDELTPEEKERQAQKEKIMMAARAEEEAILAHERLIAHRKEIRNLMKYIESYTVILLMPYLYEGEVPEAWEELIEELGPMGYSVHDEERFQLEKDLAFELIYSSMQDVSEEFAKELEAGNTIAKLMLYTPPEAEETLELEEQPLAEEEELGGGEDAGPITAAETDAIFGVVKAIYGCSPPEIEGQQLDINPDSLEVKYSKGPDIPAFWTPLTPTAKANAIIKVFPKFADKYKLPPPPTLPPVITMIFEATKSADVSEKVEHYTEEVIAMGYFSGADPSTAKKVALTPEQYDQRIYKRDGETVVIVLNRKRSDPLLSFCQLGPVYISDNTEDGKKDYEAFFPEEEEDIQEFESDEPKEHMKLSVHEEDESGEGVSVYSYEKTEKHVEEYDDISGFSEFGNIPAMELPEGENQPEGQVLSPSDSKAPPQADSAPPEK